MADELVKLDNWPIVEQGAAAAAVLKENLQGEELGPLDLPQITIAPGGINQFMVPTVNGEEAVGSVQGVVIYQRRSRTYWADALEEGGGGKPPECISEDMVHGIGSVADTVEGGLCAHCPMAKFGTDPKNKRAPACKVNRSLFMIREQDRVLPSVVKLPPTSVNMYKKYLLRISNFGLVQHSVIAKLSLERAMNPANQAYSIASAQMVSKLDPSAVEVFGAFKDKLTPQFEKMRVEAVEQE
jgi:hypothetical protein